MKGPVFRHETIGDSIRMSIIQRNRMAFILSVIYVHLCRTMLYLILLRFCSDKDLTKKHRKMLLDNCWPKRKVYEWTRSESPNEFICYKHLVHCFGCYAFEALETRTMLTPLVYDLNNKNGQCAKLIVLELWLIQTLRIYCLNVLLPQVSNPWLFAEDLFGTTVNAPMVEY